MPRSTPRVPLAAPSAFDFVEIPQHGAEEKIYNPATGKMVLKSGKIGKEIMKRMQSGGRRVKKY